MNRTLFSRVCLFVACIAYTGCASVESISDDPAYPTDYVVNQVYRLKQPLFMMNESSHCLMFPGSFWDVPNTIAEYQSADKTKWRNVKGVLDVGSLIQVTELIAERKPVIGLRFKVKATIMGGAYKGIKVELWFVSRREFPVTKPPQIDPAVLELAK